MDLTLRARLDLSAAISEVGVAAREDYVTPLAEQIGFELSTEFSYRAGAADRRTLVVITGGAAGGSIARLTFDVTPGATGGYEIRGVIETDTAQPLSGGYSVSPGGIREVASRMCQEALVVGFATRRSVEVRRLAAQEQTATVPLLVHTTQGLFDLVERQR